MTIEVTIVQCIIRKLYTFPYLRRLKVYFISTDCSDTQGVYIRTNK